MILYLDSSALVKLYVAEPHSTLVREAVRDAALCCSHLIAYAEVRAALARALRLGRETAAGLQLHKQEFDRAWSCLDVVLPDAALVRRAGELAEQCGLRGYDSVHLAAAESVAGRLGPTVEFVLAVFDVELAAGARTLGLRVLE
ncbi:MAG: type II toxin-antitoxin system VapC family toxin [Deferrisomatales bacterium]